VKKMSDQVSFGNDAVAAGVEPVAVDAPAAGNAGDNKPKAVLVENLSPSVTTKTLNDFFSLCGTIESISLHPKAGVEDGTLEAVVSFETSGAADTAVLLTNAILVDRTISISYFNGQAEGEGAKPAKEGETEGGKSDQPSVWASILAASYKFSDDVRNRANEVDTKYGVTKGFADSVNKIDQTLGLTEKFNAMSSAVHQKSEELGVNQRMESINAGMTQAGQKIQGAANAVFDSAMQNQYVSSAWNTLAGWGSSLISGWTQITQEADQLYTQQTGRVRNAPAAADANAAAPADAAAAAEPAAAAAAEPAAAAAADAPAEAAAETDTIVVPHTEEVASDPAPEQAP